jgi:ELWxxDGT repeat protein
MKKLLLFTFIILISPILSRAQSVNLVKDLNPGINDGIDQWKNKTIVFNDMLLFAATDGTTGLELYTLKSGVLTLVKDINSGTDNSNPDNFILYNNKIYFTAYDAVHGEEIWSTDGTAAGTMLAVEAIPGADPSSGNGPGILIAGNNGKLYFSVAGNAYISDGTTLGTSKVAGLGSVDFNEDFSIASPRVTTYGNGIAFISKSSSAEVNIYSLDASTTPVLLKTVPINQYGTTDIYGISEVSAGVLFALYNSAYDTYNGLFVINKSDGSVTEIK